MSEKKFEEDVVLISVFTVLVLSVVCYSIAWTKQDITEWSLYNFFAEHLVFFERRFKDTLQYSQNGAVYYFCTIGALIVITPGIIFYEFFVSKRGLVKLTATRNQTFTSLPFVVIFFFPVFWWSASLHRKINIGEGSILSGNIFPIIACLYICWAAFTFANVIRIVFNRDVQDA